MRFILGLALLPSLTWPLAAAAQERALANWLLASNGEGCTIERRPTARDDTRLLLLQRSGEPYRIRVDGPGWTGLAPGELTVEVLTDWETKPVLLEASVQRTALRSGAMQVEIRGDTANRLAAARSLRFRHVASGKLVGHVEAPGIELALTRVRRCALEDAHLDPGSGAPPATLPTGGLTALTADDYPAAALRAGAQGRSVAKLTVSAGGKVSACTITQSSGSELLDEAACGQFARRGRFTPARDAQGKPTEATVERSINWRLPE